MKRALDWLWAEFRRPLAFIAYVHGLLFLLMGPMIVLAPYVESLLGGQPPQEPPERQLTRALLGGGIGLVGFLLERWGRHHATAWEGILMGLGYTIGGPLLVVFVMSSDKPEMGMGDIVFVSAFFIAMGVWTLRWGLAKRRVLVEPGR